MIVFNNFKSVLLSVLSITIILLFFHFLLSFNEGLPNLSKIFNSFKYNYPTLVSDIQISLSTLIPGLLIGIFIGIFIGLISGYFNFLDFLVSPTLNFLRAIPPIALAPVFIIVIGIGANSKISIIAFGTFFPVWINTYQGVKNIPEKLHIFCKDFHLSYFKKFFKVFLPHTTPHIISGIRISIATSLVMLFISEWIASSEGIGYFMSLAHTLNNLDDLLVGVFILGFISLILDFIFVKTTNYFFPWIKK